jgi:hypothetical protein
MRTDATGEADGSLVVVDPECSRVKSFAAGLCVAGRFHSASQHFPRSEVMQKDTYVRMTSRGTENRPNLITHLLYFPDTLFVFSGAF